MGKIRIKTLGTEEEQAQKERAKVRREEKKKRLTHIAGLKGGERIVDMSAETAEITEASSVPSTPASVPSVVARKPSRPPRSHGKAYLSAKKLIEPGKLYPISEAIELVKKTSITEFDGSVEVHLNTKEKGIRGQVSFPHGIGREVRVAIANDELIDKVINGKIDFDILVSSPVMMPKLVKVAKILGPRGLMPNPKTGTISDKPEELAKKLSSGQIQFKTESEAPIIHMVIGRVSFPAKHLEENFSALLKAIGTDKIKSVFLKSTMSPSIRVKI